MGIEINLMKNYPRTKRDPKARAESKTEEDRSIARQFDKDFFDGNRKYGYGGYNYNSRFWQPVVPDFINHYSLNESSSILDVGSGKGFTLKDFKDALPGIKIQGIDISQYAIENSLEVVKDFQEVGDAKDLPYEDKAFDLAISIVTLHNLPRAECGQALREMTRVSRNSFITLDAYSNEEEKKAMEDWNLTALTVMHVDEWVAFFEENGYTGDYYWFKP